MKARHTKAIGHRIYIQSIIKQYTEKIYGHVVKTWNAVLVPDRAVRSPPTCMAEAVAGSCMSLMMPCTDCWTEDVCSNSVLPLMRIRELQDTRSLIKSGCCPDSALEGGK